MKKIKISNLEQIETDQLIWEIENSKDFYIYEIQDNEDMAEIVVKVINSNKKYSF